MLESMLNLVQYQGSPLPTPSFAQLRKEYLAVAAVSVPPLPLTGKDQNCNRIITLRPACVLDIQPQVIDYHSVRGYFAYGREWPGRTNFTIYAPHRSAAGGKLPRQLRTAIDAFAMRLVQEGYSMPGNAIQLLV